MGVVPVTTSREGNLWINILVYSSIVILLIATVLSILDSTPTYP